MHDASASPKNDAARLRVEAEARARSQGRATHINAVLRGIRRTDRRIINTGDRDSLLRGICEAVTQSDGYSSVRVVLVDVSHAIVADVAAGALEHDPLNADLADGRLPEAWRMALTHGGPLVLEPSAKAPHVATLLTRIEHAGVVFGFMTVTLPAHFAQDDAELRLFAELGGDVGFALHNLELERQREQATEALRASEQRFRTIVETFPGLIWVCRAALGQGPQYVSERVEEIYGVSANTLLAGKQQLADLVHPDDLPRLRERAADALASREAYSSEHRIRRADGRLLWVLEIGQGVYGRDGNLECVIGSTLDITARKAAAEHLEQRTRQLEALYHNAPDAIVRLDRDLRFLFVNRVLAELTEIPRERFVGRTARELGLPVDTRSLWEKHVREAFESAQPVDFEFQLKRGQTVRSFETRVVPETGADGGVESVVAIARDVTGARAVAEQRRQVEAQLQQSQKMEAIGQLAGGIAHDFNNLMTAILGNVELLQDRFETAAGDEVTRKSLEQIERAGKRAATLTRQLLAFSRRQLVQPEILDLNRMIRDLTPMYARLIGEQVRLESRLAPDLKPVRTDPGHVEQILMNLIVNARDALDGQGVITVTTRNVELDQDYCLHHPDALPGNYACVTVADTGPGIQKEHLDRVFEPFFTTKPVGKGTGLGLSSVFGILQQAGGHVAVYSEPGYGACFRLYWPTAEGALPTVAQGDPHLLPRGTETVLVCEDEASVRDLAARLLGRGGYRVMVAENAAAAQRVAEQHAAEIDLLVTDVILPDANGREVAEALLARNPRTRVLYVSGYTSNVIAHHGVIDAGVEFLEKPFSLRGLLQRVREVLDAR